MEYGIIRVKNSGYELYEELLMERDALKKEAYHWNMEYIKVFGDLLLQLFRLKVSCIEKKKRIAILQAAINRGETVEPELMQKQIDREMKEYKQELSRMVLEHEKAIEGEPIDRNTLSKIKKLYYKLTKLLHPDINPYTEKVPELKQLWQMVVTAYRNNDLKRLEEAEILIHRALEKLGMGSTEIEIENLEEKIRELREEISEIKGTTPYQYRYLLEDAEAVKKKKDELKQEIRECEEYEKELDALLKDLLGRGVRMIWNLK